MYESSGSKFFRTTTGIQSGPGVRNFITEILCNFRLVLEGKAGKKIPASSRSEYLEKFSANNFALWNAEFNTSGPLNREGIADLLCWEQYYQFAKSHWKETVTGEKSAKLRALAPTRLTQHWYTSYAPTCLTHHYYAPYVPARRYPHQLVPDSCLSCAVLLQLKGKVFFVCTPVIHSPPFLSSLLFYHRKLFYMLVSFFCFKAFVTPLFTQLFCHNIYISSNNEGAGLMKTVQIFDFHFIPNCSIAFKVMNWKLWEQIL